MAKFALSHRPAPDRVLCMWDYERSVLYIRILPHRAGATHNAGMRTSMRRHCLSRSTWRPLCGERNCPVPFALCFYPHSRGAHTLLGGSVHMMRSIFSGATEALQSSERPSRRVGQVRNSAVASLDPKRIRAKEAVAIRHSLGSPHHFASSLYLLCTCLLRRSSP
jgi:hypothetical protein